MHAFENYVNEFYKVRIIGDSMRFAARSVSKRKLLLAILNYYAKIIIIPELNPTLFYIVLG